MLTTWYPNRFFVLFRETLLNSSSDAKSRFTFLIMNFLYSKNLLQQQISFIRLVCLEKFTSFTFVLCLSSIADIPFVSCAPQSAAAVACRRNHAAAVRSALELRIDSHASEELRRRPLRDTPVQPRALLHSHDTCMLALYHCY